MVDFVDLRHAMLLNTRLERFQIKSRNPYTLNFRCHLCGDSKTSKSKARGWLLEDKHQSFHFYCHNCGASLSFHNFLKSVDTLAYNEYISEKYISKATNDSKGKQPSDIEDILVKIANPSTQRVDCEKTNHLSKIKRIGQLSHDHPVKIYLDQRKIPTKEHHRIYYAPKFMTWVNTMIPDKFPKIVKDEPRIVLPFFDENKNMFGLSARGFRKDGPRYITIMLDTEMPKIFGLEKIDFNKPYKILEGAFDSLFIQNSIAMAGADGNTNGLKNLENATFVFDAESRNKEIHKRMDKVIKSGLKICIWPSNISGKDVNEMILNGVDNVEEIINRNTYGGLAASLRLSAWKKT
jgi:transcription elongation factor Elf1